MVTGQRTMRKIASMIIIALFCLVGGMASLDHINLTLLPNGYANISDLGTELGATGVRSLARGQIWYKNETDLKYYVTEFWNDKGEEYFPVTWSIPYHTYTDIDCFLDCEGTEFDYCINISDLNGLNFTTNSCAAIIDNTAYEIGGTWYYTDYSHYFCGSSEKPLDFTENINMTASLPVVWPMITYRHDGKLGVTIKHLGSTPEIWLENSLVDRCIRFHFNSNGSVIAYYGQDTTGFCNPASGSVQTVQANGDYYSYFIGPDFTDPTTLYGHTLILASNSGHDQVYWNGDGERATLNYGAFYPETFYQADVNTTSCDLDNYMPLSDGSCWSLVPTTTTIPPLGISEAGTGIAGFFVGMTAFPAFLMALMLAIAVVGLVVAVIGVVKKAGDHFGKG